MKKTFPVLLSVAFLLLIWQIIATNIAYPDLFPSLPDLLSGTFNLFITEGFYSAIFATIIRGIIGFLIAFICAFTFSTIAAFSAFWKTFFHPILVVLRSVPVVSLVLIALLWFSPPNLPVFIALITMFPILYQNILNGLENTDLSLVEMAHVFGKNKMQSFIEIYIPSAKSLIFSGISTAMGFGWRAIIIGEVLAQPVHGIGSSMKKAQTFIDISELIAWTVIAILISYLFDFIIKLISKIKLEKHFKIYKTHPSQSFNIKSISIQNLSKNFESKSIFQDLTLAFNSNEVNCLKAPSGFGKSTLLKLIAGITKKDMGEINFNKKYSFAYAFQDIRLLNWLTVEENITFVYKHKPNTESLKQKAYLLEKLELTELAHKYPYELSGGQQQRVSLARALAAKSDVLLLDEPLTGLDNELKTKIITFLEEWLEAEKPLIIWATHEQIKLKNIQVREIILNNN